MNDSVRSKMPLVSVVVATYKQKNMILDTLNSIKNQTYANIELVISDDCSPDDTVDVCRNWIGMNKHRFARVELLCSEKNFGIVKNKNKCCFAAKGEWVKPIDGDDKLAPDCVEKYVNYVFTDRGVDMVFSPLEVFGDGDLQKWGKLCTSRLDKVLSMLERDFKMLLYKVTVFPAASLFIKRNFFMKMGGYDESIPDLEDWAFWSRCADAGCKFGFVNEKLVYYRISCSSLSQNLGGVITRGLWNRCDLQRKKTYSMQNVCHGC
ncbi:MAG: glycosyltransferase family 2 protein [Prevotella sp.]